MELANCIIAVAQIIATTPGGSTKKMPLPGGGREISINTLTNGNPYEIS